MDFEKFQKHNFRFLNYYFKDQKTKGLVRLIMKLK